MSVPDGQSAAKDAGPEPAVGKLEHVGDVVSRVCMYLAALGLTVVVLINAVNVFARYVLYWALSWAEEAMVFLMIASVFLGAISVTWEQAHIRIDALTQAVSPPLRRIVEWFAVFVTALVLWPVGYMSFEVVGMLKGFDQRSDALDMPVWLPQSAVPLSLLAIPLVMALALWCRPSGSGAHSIDDQN